MIIMNNPKYIISDTPFESLYHFADGSWMYYFDRQSHEELCEPMDNNESNQNETKIVYTAIQIPSSTKPTYKDCVEKIIRLYLSSSEEFDLINSAYQGDDKEYKEWLNKLAEIKNYVKNDFENEELN